MIAYIPRLIGQLGVGCRIRHATRRFRIAKALMPVGLIVTSSMSLTMPAMAVTLSDELYRALYLDPQISQSAARSCQAVYELGIERAEKRLQLSANLSGERDLAHNFNNTFDRGETPARLRGFNQGENDLFDADIEGRYRLYDWGVSDNRISAERTRLAASRLSIEIELAERARELLEVLVAHEHTQTEISLLGRALDELVPHLEAMEAEKIGREKEIISIQSRTKAETSAQLVEAQTRLAQAQARQESLAGRVSHADIKAPESGVVSALHVKTIGAVVQAGTVLSEIVPLESELVVRAQLLPQDVADVTQDQLARISLAAYDVSRYGALEGRVVHVASNTTQEEGIPAYYETMIAIPDPVFATSGVTPDIVPGMQVTVDIIGGKRTVIDYILSPIKKATEVAFREK